MRRILSLGLALALTLALTPALAADETDLFPTVNVYPGYADVGTSDWFYDSAKLCYETGLMTGTGAGFSPGGLMTEGETAALAARIREAVTGAALPTAAEGAPWYQRYVDALADLGLGLAPTQNATRARFLELLGSVLSAASLPAINAVAALPDAAGTTVLRFYNAGVLTGVDAYGTFAGDKTLSRAEAAAMVARVVRPALRQTFVPKDYSPFTAAGVAPSALFFTNGVTAEGFLTAVNDRIRSQEDNFTHAGSDFNWLAPAGDGATVLQFVTQSVLRDLNVTADQGTPAYKSFDYQVYYSRLIDLTGGPLTSAAAPTA